MGRGTIDATTTVPAAIVDFGIDRVTSHDYLLPLGAGPLAVLMNRKKLESLPKPAQDVIAEYSIKWIDDTYVRELGSYNDELIAQVQSRPQAHGDRADGSRSRQPAAGLCQGDCGVGRQEPRQCRAAGEGAGASGQDQGHQGMKAVRSIVTGLANGLAVASLGLLLILRDLHAVRRAVALVPGQADRSRARDRRHGCGDRRNLLPADRAAAAEQHRAADFDRILPAPAVRAIDTLAALVIEISDDRNGVAVLSVRAEDSAGRRCHLAAQLAQGAVLVRRGRSPLGRGRRTKFRADRGDDRRAQAGRAGERRMTTTGIGIAGIVALFALVAMHIPLAFAMIVVGITAFAATPIGARRSRFLATEPSQVLGSMDLAAVPLFLMMGAFVNVSGFYAISMLRLRRCSATGAAVCPMRPSAAARPLVRSAARRRLRSRPSRKWRCPKCWKRGYAPGFSGATIAAGGALKALIPPSLSMILYCVVARTYIFDVFIAAVIRRC